MKQYRNTMTYLHDGVLIPKHSIVDYNDNLLRAGLIEEVPQIKETKPLADEQKEIKIERRTRRNKRVKDEQ